MGELDYPSASLKFRVLFDQLFFFSTWPYMGNKAILIGNIFFADIPCVKA